MLLRLYGEYEGISITITKTGDSFRKYTAQLFKKPLAEFKGEFKDTELFYQDMPSLIEGVKHYIDATSDINLFSSSGLALKKDEVKIKEDVKEEEPTKDISLSVIYL